MNARAKKELDRKLLGGLTSVARALTKEARKRARRQNSDTGQRSLAITHVVEGDNVFWGIPKSSGGKHSIILEKGFKPHFVPQRYISGWRSRNKVARVGKAQSKSPDGLFVGGPNSRFMYGGGGARGKFFAGRGRLVSKTYRTQGGKSPYLKSGKVGSPILQPTWKEDKPRVQKAAFKRGYTRA